MPDSTLDFEIPKSRLIQEVAKPLLLSQVLFVVIAGGTYYWIASQCPRNPGDGFDILKSLRDAFGMSWGVIVALMAVVGLISLKFTAYKVRITDSSLEVFTFWDCHKFRWSEIAEVKRFFYKWREYLVIKTWDASTLVLSPPLKPMEALERELKARALDAVSAPERPTLKPLSERKRELFGAEVMRGLRQAAITLFSMAALFWGYCVWQNLREPVLEIPNVGRMPITTGKKIWISNFLVSNYGRDFQGLKIQFSGDAFNKKLLTNPTVLLESHDGAWISPGRMREQTRELLTLQRSGPDLWTVDANKAWVKHKDDFFVESLTFLPTELLGGTAWQHNFELTLFADVPKAGKGQVKIKVAPNSYPSKIAETTYEVYTDAEMGQRDTPIASAGIPSEFPVSAYPNSQIKVLAATHATLVSPVAEKDLVAFYKNQLKHKGWRIVENSDATSVKFLATKRKEKLNVEFNQVDQDVSADFDLDVP
jgi:hypothetical protein